MKNSLIRCNVARWTGEFCIASLIWVKSLDNNIKQYYDIDMHEHRHKQQC
jgi:drug/metabolite transporter superfamily protein YnfA